MATLPLWISAARPRTLPLAVAGLILGNIIALSQGSFRVDIAVLSILTAVSLQVLSNFANDYGDFVNGADNAERIGPQRAVQSGQITAESMLRAIIVLAAFSLIAGIALLSAAWNHINWIYLLVMLGLGILSVIAAIQYTATSNPYGYKGLGDLAVFIFFGLVAVLGSYFIQTGTIDFLLFLPAVGFGLLSTAVLNLNNMRDIENDRNTGKYTIPVRIGLSAAKKYHYFLIVGGIAFFLFFGFQVFDNIIQYLFLTPSILLIQHLAKVVKTNNHPEFNSMIKQLALSSSFLAVSFSIALLI